jgi:putative ABC transport system permease protein
MLRNCLRIAIRNLRRQPGYATINVIGLALGVTCAFFILQFVQDERSFDRFHEKGDRIYRLVADSHTASQTTRGSMSSAPMGPTPAEEFPEVEVVRLFAAYHVQRPRDPNSNSDAHAHTPSVSTVG